MRIKHLFHLTITSTGRTLMEVESNSVELLGEDTARLGMEVVQAEATRLGAKGGAVLQRVEDGGVKLRLWRCEPTRRKGRVCARCTRH